MTRARLGLAATAVAAAALATHAAASTAKPPSPAALRGSVRIAFSGEGHQTLDDYKQWIFQSDQECYYDKLVKQTASFRWATSFPTLGLARLAKPSGRTLSSVQTTAAGTASGPEVRGDCGSDDVPPGWVQTITCAQALQFSGAGSLAVVRGKPGSAVLVLHAPAPTLESPTACSLVLRGHELLAKARVDLAKLAKLKPGKAMSVKLGTTSELNCSTHPAPYEGTQVTDDCHDTLARHGTVTLLRT